jgi:thiol-disulfide isomerase/thioredoxin
MKIRIQLVLLVVVLGAAVTNAQQTENTARESMFEIGSIEIPEGDSAEVAEFLQELTELQKEILADYRTAMAKVSAAQSAAASTVLRDPEVSEAHFTLAAKIGLPTLVRSVASQAPSEQSEVLEMVKRQLSIGIKKGLQRSELSNASSLVSYLERGGNTGLAADACESFVDLLKGVDDSNAKAYATRFEGLGRRLNLLGNPIELTGQQLDGSEFDWDAYRGKVVLVDFWATWCGPCLAEAPNVKKNYEKYHDRGFEVVAISLDTKKSALQDYVKSKQVPWVNLFQSGAGWKHPMAVKYGVSAIPTVFLVNREGNVVSLRARGAELGKQLKILLETKEDLEREIAECSQQLEDSPGSAALLTKRANALAATDQWARAAEDWRAAIKIQPDLAAKAFEQFREAEKWDRTAEFGMLLIQQQPDDVQRWLKVSPVLAVSGNPDTYRDFCEKMVQQFKDSDDWRESRVTTKSCLLLPDCIPLDQLPQSQVAAGFEGEHTPYTLAWSWNVRALLAYRNGDAKNALKYLQESEKNQPVAYAKALNYPLSALIHHQLGDSKKANQALSAAGQFLKQLSASEASKYHHDVMIAGVIFDEANRAITGTAE